MKTVDVTFQNLDSSEISLTDVSHYFDSDPTKLVSGLRKDGKLPSAYIADTTTANGQVGGPGLHSSRRGGASYCFWWDSRYHHRPPPSGERMMSVCATVLRQSHPFPVLRPPGQ